MTDASTFAPRVIRASAGTGKTFQLSNRLIALLVAGAEPSSILATTFTRKAAGEILSRVLGRLADAALNDSACRDLAQHIGSPRFDPAAAQRLLANVVRQLPQFSVCTLDSFFARILDAFALEAGAGVGWHIAEGHVDQQLRREGIRAMLNEHDPQALVEVIRLLNRDSARRAVHEQIDEVVSSLHELYRQTPADVWGAIDRPPTLDRADVAATVAALSEAPIPEHKPMAKARRKDYEQALTEDWASFIDGGLAGSVAAGRSDYSRKAIPGETIAIYQRLIQHARGVLIGRLIDQTHATRQLLERFDAEYQRLKSRRGAMRFDDVTFKLVEARVLGALEPVYYRLDGRVRHLLLDEFQDTSMWQWYVLQPIADEILAHRDAADSGRSFFCVGDVKQAIYGWRGGHAEIFDTLESQWAGIESEPLQRTYRCSPPVVDVVNTVFASLPNNPALDDVQNAASQWASRFSEHETAQTDAPGYVELRTAAAAENKAGASARAIATTVDLVQRIHREAPGRSIGILVRRNATVARLIYELRRPEIDIRASEEGGNPLTDSPAVCVITSLLRMADHPGDTVAAYHVAYSPLGPAIALSDHHDAARREDVAASVRAALLEHGYGLTIAGWAETLVSVCDRRDLERLLQLVELAHAYDADATLRPTDFNALIEQQRVEDPTAADVRVMTVHQAKGLEFDMVVLPELEAGLGRAMSDTVLVDRPQPGGAVECVTRYVDESVRRLDERLQRMYDQSRDARLRDDLCVLYVAMTRARHALHMVIPPSKLTKKGDETFPRSAAGLLRAALHGTDPVAAEQILYAHGDPDWYTSLGRAEPAADVAEPPVDVRLAAPAPRRIRGLVRQSPSAVAGGRYVDLSQRLRLDTAAAHSGLVIHALFEQIEWLDEGLPDAATVADWARAASADDADIPDYVEQFRSMLDEPTVCGALSRDRYADRRADTLTIWRERPFAVRLDDAVWRGTFDRVVLWGDGEGWGGAEIVDFKTDHVSADDAASVGAAVEQYRPQIDSYREALTRLTHLPTDAIQAQLLFVTAGVARAL